MRFRDMRIPLMITAIAALIIIIAVLLLLKVGVGGDTVRIGVVTIPKSAVKFHLESPAFINGSYIPRQYTCHGADESIPLSWSGLPRETKSLLVIMEDLDAPGGVFLHWLLYNVSPAVNALPANLPKSPITDLGLQGLNDFGRYGYGGPCPPPGSVHRYVIIVLAINNTNYPQGDSRHIISSIEGIVGYAYIIGLYSS